MRQSSSWSDPRPFGGLFDQLSGSPAVDRELSDAAYLQAMLDAERALAAAQARAGLVPDEAAAAVAAACRLELYDVAALGHEALATGSPVVPLVRALSARLPAPAAPYVHLGATSQDILDTAASLVAHRALGPVLADLGATAARLAALAQTHRSTLLAARTLLQQALPTTFGLRCAGWLVGLDAARADLDRVRATRLAVQLGGAAGTLAGLGDAGPGVLELFADELGLAEPVMAWHTDRTRVGQLATALGATAAVLGKIALDVVLMAQTEVAELAEGGAGRGGSSTLPHKRNPVGAVLTRAAAHRAPGLVATLLAAGNQEHERGAGPWQAEWETVRELMHVVGGAVDHTRRLIENLVVDADRMRANLAATHGLLMAESVAGRLAPAMGTVAAHDLVERSCRAAASADLPLREVLLASPELGGRLSAAELDAALDPASYLGATDAFIDRALHAHEAHDHGSEESSHHGRP